MDGIDSIKICVVFIVYDTALLTWFLKQIEAFPSYGARAWRIFKITRFLILSGSDESGPREKSQLRTIEATFLAESEKIWSPKSSNKQLTWQSDNFIQFRLRMFKMFQEPLATLVSRFCPIVLACSAYWDRATRSFACSKSWAIDRASSAPAGRSRTIKSIGVSRWFTSIQNCPASSKKLATTTSQSWQ